MRAASWSRVFLFSIVYMCVSRLLAKPKTKQTINLVDTLPETITKNGFFFTKRARECHWPRKTTVSCGFSTYLLDCLVSFCLIFSRDLLTVLSFIEEANIFLKKGNFEIMWRNEKRLFLGLLTKFEPIARIYETIVQACKNGPLKHLRRREAEYPKRFFIFLTRESLSGNYIFPENVFLSPIRKIFWAPTFGLCTQKWSSVQKMSNRDPICLEIENTSVFLICSMIFVKSRQHLASFSKFFKKGYLIRRPSEPFWIFSTFFFKLYLPALNPMQRKWSKYRWITERGEFTSSHILRDLKIPVLYRIKAIFY